MAGPRIDFVQFSTSVREKDSFDRLLRRLEPIFGFTVLATAAPSAFSCGGSLAWRLLLSRSLHGWMVLDLLEDLSETAHS